MTLDLVAWLLILLAVVNIVFTAILVHAAVTHPWPALRERATVAVILAIVALGAGVLGGQQLTIVDLGDLWIAVLAIGLSLVSLPSLIWTLAYWGGRFSAPDERGHDQAHYDGRGDH